MKINKFVVTAVMFMMFIVFTGTSQARNYDGTGGGNGKGLAVSIAVSTPVVQGVVTTGNGHRYHQGQRGFVVKQEWPRGNRYEQRSGRHGRGYSQGRSYYAYHDGRAMRNCKGNFRRNW